MSGITPAALNAALSGDIGNYMAATTPGGIEAQEARGQTAFVTSDRLPIDMGRDGKCLETLTKLGFVFGNPVDKIFIECKMPAGWSKRATEHSMWSDLLDDKGRVRAAIFFKASFHDYKSHMRLTCRYGSNRECLDQDGNLITGWEKHIKEMCVAKDGENVIFHGVIFQCDDYAASDRESALIEKWLNDNFPDWRDPVAYWD